MLGEKKEIIKKYIAILIVMLILIYSIIVIIQYSIEGEKNMPFNLSKITVVSSAEGVGGEIVDNKWKFKIAQNNDIYFSVEKNEEYKKKENIKSVVIENIMIDDEPQEGNIKMYMPNSSEGTLFSYNDNFLINGSLKYKAGEETNYKTLEIGGQGGTALFRMSNTNLGEYSCKQTEEIVHDGKLLTKINTNLDKIKFKVTFDFIINLKYKAYKTTVSLDLPYGDITENGFETQEIINKGQFVFKRV